MWKKPTDAQLELLKKRQAHRKKVHELLDLREGLLSRTDLAEKYTAQELRDMMALFSQLEELISNDRTLLYKPFDKQIEFHRNRTGAPWRMIVAGNGAGKTLPLVVECVWLATQTHPYLWTPDPPVLLWFTSINHDFLRDVAKPKFDEFVPVGTSYDGSDHVYTLPNGSVIVLKSQRSGWEKFQGAAIPAAFIDEEGEDEEESERIFKECDHRTSRVNGQIVIAFTGTKCFNWTMRLYERAKEGDKKIELHTWSTYDNPYYPKERVAELEKECRDEEEVRRRIFGEMIPIGGNLVFSREVLFKLRDECKNKPFYYARMRRDSRLGRYSLEKSNEVEHLRVFVEPEPDKEYVIGVDGASGEGGTTDFSVAVVLCRDTLEVCATFRSNIHAPADFAPIIEQLAQAYYCTLLRKPALIIVEDMLHGYAIIDYLLGNHKNYLWYGRTPSGRRNDRPGFRTSAKQKMLLESVFKEFLHDGSLIINDIRIVDEALTYVRNENTGKSGALRGRYDDMVVATMLALYAHVSEPFKPKMLRIQTERQEIVNASEERAVRIAEVVERIEKNLRAGKPPFGDTRRTPYRGATAYS